MGVERAYSREERQLHFNPPPLTLLNFPIFVLGVSLAMGGM